MTTSLPTTDDILAYLPHRYPFLLVDKVISLTTNNIHCVKNVSINEPFFQGHFPDNPIMPGALQVEALAQALALLALSQVKEPTSYDIYFLGIDECRFKTKVSPGDILNLHCSIISQRRHIAKASTKALTNEGKLSCKAILTAMISPKKPQSPDESFPKT